jgi:hypothetical protein
MTMHRLGAWGGPAAVLTAAVALGVWTGDAPAQPPPMSGKPGEAPGLFGKMFGVPAKPAPKREATPRGEAARQSDAQLQEELAAYYRRLAVCDRMREIAQESSDEALRAKAEGLEAQAFTLYQQRIAHLPASRVDKPRDPEATLDGKLGGDAARSPARAASRLKPADGTAGQTASTRDTREVNP